MASFQVLVVDDEAMMRAGEMRILRDFKVEVPDFHESVSFELLQVDSGEAALEAIEKKTPDIMLLDLGLPGIQGLDVLQKVVADGRDVLTIVVTAYASIESAVATTKQGAFDFLAKPFTPDELRNTVAKATRHLFAQRHARKLQREKHQMRFQLISIVSHELKSPLNAIEGFLRVLQDPNVAKDAKTTARFVDRSLVRLEGMRKLIVDLLDLTRIESGQKKRTLSRVDLCELAKRGIDNIATDASARNIVVESSLPPRAEILADAGELEIIINNLLSNAVKYNQDNGKITVIIYEGPTVITLQVKDTGIGLTKTECAKLFQDFVRIKNAKTIKIPGSGLGLSIVKKLVTLYGGTVDVDSEPNVGTTFTATFPISAEPIPPAQAIV